MWKFLRGGATVIPGATFIPESRVLHEIIVCDFLRFFFHTTYFSFYTFYHPFIFCDFFPFSFQSFQLFTIITQLDTIVYFLNLNTVYILKHFLSTVHMKAKICIKYRKHWKSYVSFQLSWQIGLIWALLKLQSKC